MYLDKNVLKQKNNNIKFPNSQNSLWIMMFDFQNEIIVDHLCKAYFLLQILLP